MRQVMRGRHLRWRSHLVGSPCVLCARASCRQWCLVWNDSKPSAASLPGKGDAEVDVAGTSGQECIHNYVMKPWHLPNNPASPSYYRLQHATSQLFGNQSPQHLHHHAVPGDPHAHTPTASWTSLFPALGPLACV